MQLNAFYEMWDCYSVMIFTWNTVIALGYFRNALCALK